MIVARVLSLVVPLAVRHTRCRLFCCAPDWVEAIALGQLRPRCKHCKRIIP